MISYVIRLTILVLSFFVAYYLRQEYWSIFLGNSSAFTHYPQLLLCIITSHLILLYWRGLLASSWLKKKLLSRVNEHLLINLTLLILASLIGFYQQHHLLSRTFLITFVVLNSAVSVLFEVFVYGHQSRAQKTLLIGDSNFFNLFQDFCHKQKLGIAFLASSKFVKAKEYEQIKLLEAWSPDQILVCGLTARQMSNLNGLCVQAGVSSVLRDLTKVSVVYRHDYDFTKYGQYLKQFMLEPNSLENHQREKRLLDLLVLMIFAPLWIPTMIVVAVILWLFQEKVFYRQARVGQFGRVFNIWKFCSMHNDSTQDFCKPLDWNDCRLTRFGWFLRRSSLDELPQILNVLRGEMSLVGPRPELVNIVNESHVSMHWKRCLVKPGITGLWQIHGRKQPIHNHLKYDFFYLKNHNFMLDIYIMIKTIPSILLRRGAH